MRLKSLAPQSASATHWDRPDRPAGFGDVRTVRHWVYYPRYHHVYLNHANTDPYTYRYSPRGYYPYYNSAYWGAPRRGYHHVKWHYHHHGGHRLGDW